VFIVNNTVLSSNVLYAMNGTYYWDTGLTEIEITYLGSIDMFKEIKQLTFDNCSTPLLDEFIRATKYNEPVTIHCNDGDIYIENGIVQYK
jgi:hypothetical protein